MGKNYIKWLRSKVGHEDVILVAAGAVVEGPDDTILFQKRGDHKEVVWGLPGGMMEVGETAEQTMRREVKEETGIDVDIQYFLGAYTNNPVASYPNGDKAHVILFIFVCKPSGGMLQPDGKETLDVRFDTPQNIGPLFPRHTQVIDDYFSKRNGVVR